MATNAGTLYTFIGSGNSYKVRLLEALQGFKLKHEELDFLVSCLMDGNCCNSV